MSRLKIFAFVALITFAFDVALVGDAVAGEKVKFRVANYGVKFENVAVGDEEGHIVATYESKGIIANLQGNKFLDGWPYREAGLSDANRNIGTWSGLGYGEFTDPDGDKIYVAFEGKKAKQDQPGAGTVRLIKGTGKWQAIQGKGKWNSYRPSDDRWYTNEEWDMEWPR